MTIKDILVHLDNKKSSPARLQAAINLAKANDASLTGIYVKTKPYLPAYAEVQISAQILEQEAEKLEQQTEQAAELFAKATGGNGLKAEWRVAEGDVPEVIAEQARYFDLAVVGQSDPDESIFVGDREMPDRMIMTSGRPAMVIPYAGEYNAIGKHVLIAWDASPMAARAVHDAMPFLEEAEKVTVMVINPKDVETDTGELPGADIAAHLSHHGVNAIADHVVSEMDPGDILLSRAADLGVDLIVMGAYGHARWAELILGGVTNHMLNHMTVPVLMSH
ncbi:MAG: universal stress protein [Rhodospirillales bacterium]|nr:universal stress protein [Rhodospirillales bacterium]